MQQLLQAHPGCLCTHAHRTCGTDDIMAAAVYVNNASTVANINGSTPDSKGWLKKMAAKCRCEILYCVANLCKEIAHHGGHVWLQGRDGGFNMQHCYIVPLCGKHNNSQNVHYSYPNSYTLKREIWMMRIVPHACYTDYQVPEE